MDPIYLAMHIDTNILIELELECPRGFDLSVKFGYTTKCPWMIVKWPLNLPI